MSCVLALATSLAAPRGFAAEGDIARWVEDLGSSIWQRREAALEELFRAGLPAAEALEKASGSANLELAYRARYLLSRIDPHVIQCQLIKVSLSQPARVVAVGNGAGAEGEEIAVRLAALAPPRAAPTGSEAPVAAYALRAQRLGDGRVQIEGSEASQAQERIEIRPFSLAPGAVRLFLAGEQSLVRRLGLLLERERHPYAIFVRVRLGRKSTVSAQGAAPDSEAVLGELVKELRDELGAGDMPARADALDALIRLGAAPATGPPEPVDPTLRGLAALATGDREILASLAATALEDEREEEGQEGAPGGAAGAAPVPASLRLLPPAERDSIRERAAMALLDAGDERGLQPLLTRLRNGDPTRLHAVLATLADWINTGRATEPARRAFLDMLTSDETLGRLLWEDVEAEHLLSSATQALRAESPEDKAVAARAATQIARLATGDLGSINVRLRTCSDLRRRLARRFPAETGDEVSFLLGILPSLRTSSSLTEAVVILEDVIQSGGERGAGGTPLSDDDLKRLLAAMVGHTGSEDAALSAQALQGLLRLCRSLPLAPGQLHPLGTAVVAAGEAAMGTAEQPAQAAFGQSKSIYLRQLDELLQLWAGSDRPRHAANARTFQPEAWRTWLADGAAVTSHEQRLIRERVAPSKDAAAPAGSERLIYYELDLVVGEAPGSLPPGAIQEEAFAVLDGRRLAAAPGSTVRYEDRWGNRLSLRVVKEPPPAPGQPQRVRVNSRGYLFLGVPTLSTPQGKELSVTWHEANELLLGSRPLGGGGGANYRSLVLCIPEEADEPGETTTGDLRQLWESFRDRHLLRLPKQPTAAQTSSLLGVLKSLRIKECAPLLRQLLEAQRSVDIAQHLLELGDPAGEQFLRDRLQSSDPREKVLASLALCELGRAEGIAALVELNAQNSSIIRAQSYRVSSALDAYLLRRTEPTPDRAQALGFLVEKIGDSSFQYRGFTILQRESGVDFGYESARNLDDLAQRSKGLQEAVRRAQAWWQARRAAGQ